MSAAQYVAEGWRGAMLLFRRDSAGLAHFELTLDGFWRSFLVPLLLAPLSVISGYMALGLEAGEPDGYVPVKLLAEVAGIAIYPILMIPLAKVMGFGTTYLPYIIANNWAALPITLANLVLAMLLMFAGDRWGESATAVVSLFIGLPLLVLILSYLFTIARIALGAGAGMSAALAALQFLIWLMLDSFTDRLI